jgi:hypothetical protein
MPNADEDAGLRVLPLRGWSADAVDALTTTLAVARSTTDAESVPMVVDVIGAIDPEASALIAAIRLIARRVVDELVGAEGNREVSTTSAAALGDISKVLAGTPLRLDDAVREDARAEVTQLIREAGLEYHDLDCMLGTDEQTGAPVVAVIPVKPATAHVWLLESLFDRLEAFVLRDDDLARERVVSEWYFSRWSVAKNARFAESLAFARDVREQEWSLVYRDMLTSGMPVVSGFIADPGFADVPPRQQRLARALQRSFADVFVIEAAREDHLTLNRIRGGRRYEVHQHNPSAAFARGHVLVGRLIPFEDGLWLRSPGALAFPPRSDDDASLMAKSLDVAEADGVLPDPIAIEALLSYVVGGAKPPSNVPPAASAAEAYALLDEANEWLDELGLRKQVRREDAPVELQKDMAGANALFYEMNVDAAVREWMSALFVQAKHIVPNKGGAARGAAGGKGKQKRKKQGKRRRR